MTNGLSILEIIDFTSLESVFFLYSSLETNDNVIPFFLANKSVEFKGRVSSPLIIPCVEKPVLKPAAAVAAI